MSNPALAALDAVIHGALRGAGLADVGMYAAGGSGTAIPCRVYVNPAMQQMGDYGAVSAPRVVVDIVLDDVPGTLRRGDVITVGTERYTLESEQGGSDRSISRWVVGNGHAG